MKRLKSILLISIVTIFMLGLLGTANKVNAESAGPIYLGIIALRNSGYGYMQSEKKVWKIAQYDSLSDTTADTSDLIYCIKAGAGFGSQDSTTAIKAYNQRFNLKDTSTISSPYIDVLPTGENYNKLIWMMDHIYTGIGQDNATTRNEYLKNVIPTESYELLKDDDIDVIQQLAIWYFTNPTGDYHYDNIELYINSIAGTDADYKTFEDLFGDDGWDRQDAAKALYNYFITEADGNYTSTNNTTTPISFEKSNATMQVVGSDYVAGPYKITQLLNVDYTLTANYKNYGTQDEITPTIGVKDSSGNIVSTSKTLKELVGTEFYLMMPVSSGIKGIDISINTSYTSRTATYWSVENAPSTEQPVVIVKDTPYNFSDTASIVVVVEKPFDLALRKFITNINGTEITNRIPNPDITALAAGTATTATYNHTKDPLKVSIGDTVIYTIRVYNEGEVDGYVTEITDHLPEQLEYIVDDELNIKYGWKLASSTDLRTIKTSYLSADNETTSGENKIKAFDGTTLSYKDVQIKCKVVSTNPMASKITNIADITGFTDGEGNTVVDRDSQAGNVTLPTGEELENYKDKEIARGEEYIPGQQDDDDFEKVMLKEFDLALRKFITGVNETEITSRIPNPDVTALKNGTATTATYNHTKNPIKVEVGDTVIYTIRIYNEGEVDGYANEITDHLPDQLEFLPDNEINKEYKWTVDANNNKVVKTTYLSKDNGTSNLITAFDGTTLSYKDVKIACKVVETNPMVEKITNIADITDFVNSNGEEVKDRDSEKNNVEIPADLPGYKDNEIAKDYVPGQQDDDDFEKVMLKEFDLALRKFITNVNGKEITSRIPVVDTTTLKAGTATTATYNHTKNPIKVDVGDTVIYTIRIYNEGEVDGYANEITDHLPDQLEFLPDNEINKEYGWKVDETNSKIVKTGYLSKDNETTEGENKITAFDGEKLSYKDVKVACKVVETNPMVEKITNIADITDFTNGNGESVKDRDSSKDNVEIPSDLPGYKDDEINKEYVPGQEDDDDFEKVALKEFDLALRKFITNVNGKEITSRIPNPDVTALKAGTATTATYNHSKEPVNVSIGNIVVYTIRVYNEGEVDGYANEITDHLPDQLEFLPDNEINKEYGWKVDETNSKIVKTGYLSKDNETTDGENKIAAFDGTTLSYKDVKIACKVVETNPMVKKITNIADITDFTNGNGENVEDRDSSKDNVEIPSDLPGYKDDEINKDYVPGQEDDDDFEKVALKEFDLALRKFITAVNGTEVTTRYPVFSIDENGNYVYTHTKEPVLVTNSNIVTYTIRVYNEGEINGYANLIKDDIPDGLEFLPDNETNTEYRWKMLDEDGNETDDVENAKSIVTDYLSKEQEKAEKENLLLAFNKETMQEPDHKDVKVAFKVVESNKSDRIIINQAQIADDKDEDGNEVTDKDSTPDEWIDGEDDQDIEKIKVQYFDLALRKWVTQAIVIENGKETVTETGHKAEDDPEGIVKVDLKKKNINSVTVKFRYSIRVTNEGQIAGYVKEIKDYIPDGLKFVAEDNPQWTQIEDGIITTDQAKDVLLQPGESTEVEVLLTWINDSNNMGLKVNVAEISKDYNEFDAPDIDSTPDNKKDGEDDIDDAPVMLSVATGEVKKYVLITGTVLIILASGVALIKKYVI